MLADPFAVAIACLVVAFIFLIGYISKPAPGPRLKVGQSARDPGAEAEIEDHDIDQMIEARNERRQRRGRPEIGDDLARELRRSL